MSDDLVRRLRDRRVCSLAQNSCRNDWACEQAADRIEELEGQLKTVLDRETSILRYYDAKLDAADAKLAKAEVLMFAGFAEYERRLAKAVAMSEKKPTTRVVINEGSVQKGGQNTTSQVTTRPPAPTPTKPKK